MTETINVFHPVKLAVAEVGSTVNNKLDFFLVKFKVI